MPDLSAHQSAGSTKLLLIGDSGSGKTGALASLAKAGYNLRIIDLDNGLDILANMLRGDPAIERIKFETVTEPMKAVGPRLVPAKAIAWQRAVELLSKWKNDKEDLGSIITWTTQDILVIDSLTFLGQAAMNLVLAMNARLGQQPHQSDWFGAQQMVESMLQMLYDDAVKCNVIVTSHIAYIEEEGGPMRGYPAAPGRALSPKIGRYFNSVLMTKTTGQGTNQTRKLLTNTSGIVELKNSNPITVKPEYLQTTGLAEYFKAVRGTAPIPVETKAVPNQSPT